MGQAESKQELFWDACGFGRPHLVEKCIEHGIDVNWVSEVHSCSPIHVASQGKADIVKLLIEAKCDLTAQDSRGNTAVHHAAIKGHADIVEILLTAGAKVDVQDKNGWTALHCAAYFVHLRVVEVLLKFKCDVSILNKDGRSALVETARSKENREEKILGEITRQLIVAGCDMNLKCTDLGEANFTALMFAAYHDHSEVARALIDAGCDLNIQTLYTRWTALHWASDCDNTKMVFLLVEAGADPSIKGNRGELASQRAKDLEVKDLLEKSVNAMHDSDKIAPETFSSEHLANAHATLDSAKALENLSTHDKNRGILRADMPNFPPLGITARSDPKTRYTKRSVNEVGMKSKNTAAPWRSISKHTSPSPDRDGEDGQKMFPSQDDKTNAFMDSLAKRINYMTNRIFSMSQEGSREGSTGRGEESQTTKTTESNCNGEASGDSGLSSREASRGASEINSPDDDLNRMKNLGLDVNVNNNMAGSPQSPTSPDSASTGSPVKVASPSKVDKLNMETDACLFEENRRGINILRALQERHRRSLILQDSTADEISKSIQQAADANSNIEKETPTAPKGVVTDV